MTLADFLAWERRQPAKYEFDGFQPVAMTGGSWNHAAIQRNLIGLLYNHLRGHRCQAFGSELKIQVAGSIRYPDAFVVCAPPPPEGQPVAEPVIVFEVLSPSTSTIDRVQKNREYRDTPSIQRYVMLEQDSVAATVFNRQGDDWIGHLQIGDTILALPEIDASLRMADLYEGVEIAAMPSEEQAG